MKYHKKIFLYAAIIFIPFQIQVIAQTNKIDTLNINLEDATALFIKNDCQLLAAKYNIDASKAAMIQSKLWSNPNLTIGQNVFNQQTHKWFDFTASGNTDISVQQLFLLAGKRDKQTKMAEINSKSAELQYYDLLRNLQFELRKNYFDLIFLQKSLKFYNESIVSVGATVKATEKVYEKGSIVLSEMLRLKSLLSTLQSERQDIENQIEDIQSSLRILLGRSSQNIVYFVANKDLSSADNISVDEIHLDSLVAKGLKARPDLQVVNNTIDYEEANLNYQKALATPDITVGGSWSRAGSYIPNYFALSLSIDLPLLNKNEGNIQVSEATIKSNWANLAQIKNQVENDISSAYYKAKNCDKLYKSMDKSFIAQYGDLAQKMLDNYEKRNITIIELADFFESYRASMLQLNHLQSDRIDALENLNYSIGLEELKF